MSGFPHSSDKSLIFLMCVSECVWVCVYETEIKTEIETDGKTDRDRDRNRGREKERQWVKAVPEIQGLKYMVGLK